MSGHVQPEAVVPVIVDLLHARPVLGHRIRWGSEVEGATVAGVLDQWARWGA